MVEMRKPPMKAKHSMAVPAKGHEEKPRPDEGAEAEIAASAHTHLDYIQDMVSELQRMAQHQNWLILVAAFEVVILAAAQQKRLVR
jgi:hypothetical protein